MAGCEVGGGGGGEAGLRGVDCGEGDSGVGSEVSGSEVSGKRGSEAGVEVAVTKLAEWGVSGDAGVAGEAV